MSCILVSIYSFFVLFLFFLSVSSFGCSDIEAVDFTDNDINGIYKLLGFSDNYPYFVSTKNSFALYYDKDFNSWIIKDEHMRYTSCKTTSKDPSICMGSSWKNYSNSNTHLKLENYSHLKAYNLAISSWNSEWIYQNTDINNNPYYFHIPESLVLYYNAYGENWQVISQGSFNRDVTPNENIGYLLLCDCNTKDCYSKCLTYCIGDDWSGYATTFTFFIETTISTESPIQAPTLLPTVQTNTPTQVPTLPTKSPTPITLSPTRQICPGQGNCEPGYYDTTNGNYNNWECGENCEGGKYLTDGVCNCACQLCTKSPTVKPTLNPTLNPTSNPTKEYCSGKSQGDCEDGYYDITNGNYNYWGCGENCEGGQYLTDGVCNCACQLCTKSPTVKPTLQPTLQPTSNPTKEYCSGKSQGNCNDGYYDITNGNNNYWACGENCEGGQYYTDNLCNCVCQPCSE